MTTIPASHRDILEGNNFAHIATLMKDGSPQVTPVWIDIDGDTIVFNTAEGARRRATSTATAASRSLSTTRRTLTATSRFEAWWKPRRRPAPTPTSTRCPRSTRELIRTEAETRRNNA